MWSPGIAKVVRSRMTAPVISGWGGYLEEAQNVRSGIKGINGINGIDGIVG